MKLTKHLTLFNTLVNDSIEAAATGTNRTKIAEVLKSALSSAVALKEEMQPHSRRLPDLFKALKIIVNSLTGLHTAITSKTVKPPEFRTNVKTVKNFALDKWLDAYAAAATPLETLENDLAGRMQSPEPAQDSDADTVDVTKLADKFKVREGALKIPKKVVRPKLLTTADIDMPTNVEKNERAAAEEMKQRAAREARNLEKEEQSFRDLDALDSSKPKMPRKMNGAFMLTRYPIVPVLKNEYNMDALVSSLRQARFKVHKLGDAYITLDDQQLLAINMDWMKKQSIKQSVGDYAEHVVSVINNGGSTKLALMSSRSRPSHLNSSIRLFWVMPIKRMVDRMKPSAVQDWEPLQPRDEEDHETELRRMKNAAEQTAQIDRARNEQSRKVLRSIEERDAQKAERQSGKMPAPRRNLPRTA